MFYIAEHPKQHGSHFLADLQYRIPAFTSAVKASGMRKVSRVEPSDQRDTS